MQERTTNVVPVQLSIISVAKTKQRSMDILSLVLTTYNAGRRVGSPQTRSADVNFKKYIAKTFSKKLLWIIARIAQEQSRLDCSWTVFNIRARDETIVNADSMSYMPTIDAPATQLSTVYEILQQSLNVMTHLRLNSIVCVVDQALYAKAVKRIWKNPEQYDRIIVQLGVFYTICTLLAVIGKRFKDASSQGMCIEVGIVAVKDLVQALWREEGITELFAITSLFTKH